MDEWIVKWQLNAIYSQFGLLFFLKFNKNVNFLLIHSWLEFLLDQVIFVVITNMVLK